MWEYGFMPWWIWFMIFWGIMWGFGGRWHNRSTMRRFNERYDDEFNRHEDVMSSLEEQVASRDNKIHELEERIQVLEKIVTDNHKASSLAEEIDNL